MRVTISAGGKFHLFNFASELQRHGYLEQLISSYPKFEMEKYGVPRKNATAIVSKEILQRSWASMPPRLRRLWNPQNTLVELFDWRAQSKLRESDIVAGCSSFFLRTQRRAHMFGAITVVERSSSHIAYQQRIIREEFELNGAIPQMGQLPDSRIVERELQEYEEADYIGVPSKFVARSFLEYGVPESKLIRVPHGVDLSLFQKVPKSDSVFRVIFGGGLGYRKGVHYLIRAFAELKLANAELLLIGPVSDELRPLLHTYAGTFRRIDYQPLAELYKTFSQGSVFVMPSIEEGLALVQPQAMACGLPLIATTNTGGEDIIRDKKDGFIVPIRDVDALKEKIEFLYDHPDICAEMGRSAKEYISKGFTWADYGKKKIAEFERIFSERQGISSH